MCGLRIAWLSLCSYCTNQSSLHWCIGGVWNVCFILTWWSYEGLISCYSPDSSCFHIHCYSKEPLSFLQLNFISPGELLTDPAALTAPSFPRVKLDSMLWHCCFGHIGMDATWAALTKAYVKGVNFEGPFLRDHCISCIIGKSP